MKAILIDITRCNGCFNCQLACGRWVKVSDEPYVCEGGGPEYETCAALGTNCMNDNLAAVCKANDVCNRLGLDTISAGSAIAFAMECYEKGIITRKEADDLEISWGNQDAIVQLHHEPL